jgi:YfiH family protein
LYRDPGHTYHVAEWDAFPWLLHGFGTRHSDIPERFAHLATVKQIHSAECVAAEGRRGLLGPGDALVEHTPGSVIAVKTADCVPILLVDERLRAVAAVHAGWRGTAARIVEHAVATMRRAFGSEPADLHAAIGPAIGACCYEVGPEVREQFGGQGRGPLDLTAQNILQLKNCGVTRSRIHASNLCTMCHGEEFHSFRRDKEAAGRMYSYVGVK